MHRFSTDGACRVLRSLPIALPVASTATPDALLLRLFLACGRLLVYGEDGRVIFSTPFGGNLDDPPFHAVSLPDAAIDWPGTEHYNASAWLLRYTAPGGSAEFEELEFEVAAVLSEIAVSTRSERALQASVRGWLEYAQRERLHLDQWEIRRGLHAGYQRRAGSIVVVLGGVTESLDAIRRLKGPSPDELLILRCDRRAETKRLDRMQPATEPWQTHQFFIAAWWLAESAIVTGHAVSSSANVETARPASSAVAGALSMLEFAQPQLQIVLDPPRRQ